MSSTNIINILALFFTMFYFFFPIIVTAQDQHPFVSLIVPLQNPSINGSQLAGTLSLHNTDQVGTKGLIYFFFGLFIGAFIIVVIGAILYFIFGRSKLNPVVPSDYYIDAPKKGFVKQLPDTFNVQNDVPPKKFNDNGV
ncbi:unnamed protein product [Amaranthus hypochondriacus]